MVCHIVFVSVTCKLGSIITLHDDYDEVSTIDCTFAINKYPDASKRNQLFQDYSAAPLI